MIIEHFNNHGLVDIEPNLIFQNETIISNNFIKGCYINMNNVAIENGTTLTVEAYGTFHVLKEDKHFLICYPNPASQYLNIDLTIPETINFTALEIYQMDNRLVNLVELTNRGKFNQKIDIQDLADGIFTICLLFDNKQKSCCKIIKQAGNKN